MKSGFYKTDNVSLPYYIEGKGQPCIVVSDPDYSKKVLSPHLRKHLKLFFTEPRVFHIHNHPIKFDNVTMETLANDIENLREHLQLDQTAIMGHSIGGLFALEYTKKYPENVSHLIMLNTPPQLEYWNTLQDYWRKHASIERILDYEKNKSNLERIRERISPSELSTLEWLVDASLRWYDTSFDSRYLWEGYRINNEGLAHIMNHVMSSYDVRADTPVEVPVFMSQSIHDYIVPYRLWDDYRDVFSNLTLNVFEKSGHTPQLEEQELFDKLLLEWIHTN